MRPWRAYITGTTEPNGKKHLNLSVETTKHKHPKYKEILQKIKERLEEDHITKEELEQLPLMKGNYSCTVVSKNGW